MCSTADWYDQQECAFNAVMDDPMQFGDNLCIGQTGGYDADPDTLMTEALDCSDCTQDRARQCCDGFVNGCGDPLLSKLERLTCETCCQQAEGTIWSFYESETEQCFCEGCLYTFYVLVECGTEMHLPFFDAEGMRVRVFDAVTGDQLLVLGRNECAAEIPR